MDNNLVNKAWNEILDSRGFSEVIATTSSSEDDLMNRMKVYSDVFDNYADTVEFDKNFSGYSEMPLLGLNQISASLSSYVRSFAGYLSIERSMDQPSTLLWYDDILGVTDNRIVSPNIGKDNLDGISAKFNTKASLIAGQTDYTISTNKKLIPRSVEVTVQSAPDQEMVTITDDAKGNLLAPAGILTKGNVNYATGIITFTLAQAPQAGGSYSVSGNEDVAGDPAFGQLTGPGNNRFKLNHKNIIVTSSPDMLIGEMDLMTTASAKKSIGHDPSVVVGKKLTELYTKLINKKLVSEVQDKYTGDTYTVNMKQYTDQFTDYNSRLDAFQAEMVEIDTNLAKRTVKATTATAYLVGTNVGNMFRKLRGVGQFVDNTESTYVNDLVGTFNGRPVLRHLDIDPNVGYAIHKTAGGELAPVIRGIHLPLTSTPTAMNYNNVAQIARGVYYQEANESIMPELSYKFKIVDK